MNGSASSRLAARLCVGVALALAAPAFAQSGSASADAAALNSALRALAQSPNSVEALVAAGNASLKVDDIDAALGFFRRASTLSPQDGRATAGLAAVMVRQRHPLEALRLFAQVEQAGPLSPASLAERGLAYDLIGDNVRAQKDYATALALGPDPIVARRLALSQAIAGNQAGAEATLLPLLQHGDLAAYRTRAFSLAISGRGDEAVSIAETMLPATLSSRIAPYLRYMPRLTRAQQAAAADLGAFPRAGDIGRDDPQIAAYAATLGVTPARAPQSVDARLVPNGAPLGAPARPTVAAATPAPPPVRTVPMAAATPPAPTPSPSEPAPRTIARSTSGGGELPERARAMLLQHPELAHAAAPRASEPPAGQASPTVAAPVAQPSPAPAPPVAVPTETRVAAAPAPAPPAPEPPPASAGPAPVVVARLAEAQPPPSTVAPEAPPAAAAIPAPPPVAAPARPSLSEAFGDLRAAPPGPAAAAPTGAVDITKIQPRRPAAPPKPAPPKPPPVPSREWVQVATGRSTGALAFDWRRLKKEAGGALDKEKPSTAEWGRTHRLVIGPFASAAAADKMVARLKDKKIDAFRFTSDEGQDVDPLD